MQVLNEPAGMERAPAMGRFERYLTLWVALCIVAGVLLGQRLPGFFQAIASLEAARVNIPVGLLIWVMIIPMLLKIDFSALGQVRAHARGIGVTLFVNWAVKPFSMALLGWVFIRHVLAPWLPQDQLDSYIAGLILLAAAPCTAMVFVWSQLVKGDANYTLVQVSVNDLIMVVAFAPIAAFLLGVTNITVPWETLVLSTVLYVVLPLAAGMATRHALQRRPGDAVADFVARLKPWSIVGLIATVVLLFGFQAGTIVDKPLVIALIAVPLIVQSYGIFAIALVGARWLKLPHNVAGPACLIGTSNFFELAVAVAISLFGLNSGAALATVVGVLVEVPVMLSLVALVNRAGQRAGVPGD